MEDSKKRILVAEDEETLSFFLKKTLEEAEQYEVEISHTGHDAIQKIMEDTFDLVIADLRMPDLGGLELLQAVRVLAPATKTILMSAYGSQEVETEAKHLGVEAYISKPFLMEEMVGLVNRATRPKSQEGGQQWISSGFMTTSI